MFFLNCCRSNEIQNDYIINNENIQTIIKTELNNSIISLKNYNNNKKGLYSVYNNNNNKKNNKRIDNITIGTCNKESKYFKLTFSNYVKKKDDNIKNIII